MQAKTTKIYDPGASEQIGWRDKLCYGLGGFGFNIWYIVGATFLTYFYTNVLGISIAAIGTIMLISRIFDGGTDVIMGVIINKTNTKWGKARPWILWTSIPFALSLLLMFTVPNSTDKIKLIYIFVTYNFSNAIMGTAAFLPFNTLNSLLTRDQGQRTMCSNMRQIFCCAGQLIFTAITMPICTHFGNTQMVWVAVIGVYSVILALGGLICFWGTRERAVYQAVQSKEKKTSAWAEFISVLKNKYWYMAFGLWLFQSFYSMCNNTAVTYFCQYELGNVNYSASLLTVENTALVIGIFACPILLKLANKRNLAVMGTSLAIIGQVLVILFPENLTVLNAAAVIRGFGIAPLSATVFAMISDTVEYGQWKTHIRSEGIIFSAATVGMKVASGLGTWVISMIYASAGFDGTLAVQSGSAMGAIRNVYYFGTMIILVLTLVLLFAYKLDKEYPSIIKELEAREAKGEL